MTDIILKKHQFQCPIERVWKAITEASEISSWFIQADFMAEVGYHYTFTHENTVITGDVLVVNPVTKLVYTWMVKGTNVITTVSWKLESNSEGTMLTLEHSGISNYPGETAVAMFQNFNGGWDACLSGLEKYLTEE